MMNTVTEISTREVGEKYYYISIKSHSCDEQVVIAIGATQVTVNANELRIAVDRATSQRVRHE
jgi:hypothetical protein